MSKMHRPISLFALQNARHRGVVASAAAPSAASSEAEPTRTPVPESASEPTSDSASGSSLEPIPESSSEPASEPAPEARSDSAFEVAPEPTSEPEPELRGKHAAVPDAASAASGSPADASASTPSATPDAKKASGPAHAKKPAADGKRLLGGLAVAAALLVGVGVGFFLGHDLPDRVIPAEEQRAEMAEELQRRDANAQERREALGIDEADRVLADNLDPITVYPVENEPTAELARIADIDVSPGTSVKLDVPLVNQLDTSNGGRALMSGCEVASLAMLLRYSGVEVTKEQLQDEMPTVDLYDAKGFAGDPNYAFVGMMEGSSMGGVGYSVYHAPVAELAQKHLLNLPYEAIDLTGQNFTALLKELADGNPCWIITTESFRPYVVRETWKTADGPIIINWELHSVVVTGFDDENVYINDPYGYTQSVPYERTAFEEAWKIMGSQCVTIVPTESRSET